MINKNGFTLLELLIAAALIGVLAMFATQAYRASASDIRIENAKAYARLLFAAKENCLVEYPGSADCYNEDSLRGKGFLETRAADINNFVGVTITNEGKVCYQGRGHVTDQTQHCTDDGETFN